MLIKEIAQAAGTNPRTIQRDIAAYNKLKGTTLTDSLKEDVSDEGLLAYLQEKRSFRIGSPSELNGSHKSSVSDDLSEKGVSIPKEPKKQRQASRVKPKQKNKTDLQVILSANWMVLLVLFVILWVDMFCFGVIGDYEFGEKWGLAWLPFAVIGLAVGFGSIVTYNRISEEKVANRWKYIFGGLQLMLFEFVVNDWLVLGAGVAGVMFVLVSIGTQRSIKG